MELKVAQIMEDELRALPNVKKVKTECQNGSAMFTVEFQMTVLEKELEQHFDLVAPQGKRCGFASAARLLQPGSGG